MLSRVVSFSCLCGCFLALAACDGEPQRISDFVPYTMERTAGTGVAYVRAKLLPKKELKAVPVEKTVKSAEPVFEKKQAK